MSKRRVRPEELELWQQVARSAEKLNRSEKSDWAQEALSKAALPDVEPVLEPTPAVQKKFRIGQKAKTSTRLDMPKTTSDTIAGQGVHMDAKTFAKMKRGKLVPEGKIDLHGMTLDQAHSALNRFVMTSHSRGLRLVLVITGKGGKENPFEPLERPRGVLKRQVPQWLRMPPLSSAILQVSEASRRHGGSGAYYVYLRRR